MAPRFNWGMEQVEEFFNLLCRSYNDYLIAKELRRMDEFYEMIGNAIGADGLIVQNFLKKTGRAYRDILLQAETCADGDLGPERKLRGSSKVYDLYEQYYQMYYLGYVPQFENQNESLSIQRKQASDLGGRKRKNFTIIGDPSLTATHKRRALQHPVDLDNDENVTVDVDSGEITDHGEHEELLVYKMEQLPQETDSFTSLKSKEVPVREQTSSNKDHSNNRRKPANNHENLPNGSTSDSTLHDEAPSQDTIFGKPGDFQERFLKLMENQNQILANIADELNLIRHAVLDANGLQTITYVK